MSVTKPRVVKDFEKLDEAIQEQVKLAHPYGFAENLIHYNDKDGNRVSALPFETEEKYYLIRMTKSQALQIIEDDEDYDDDGELKESIKSDYEDKYGEFDSDDDDDEEDDDPKNSSEDDDDEDDDDY